MVGMAKVQSVSETTSIDVAKDRSCPIEVSENRKSTLWKINVLLLVIRVANSSYLVWGHRVSSFESISDMVKCGKACLSVN